MDYWLALATTIITESVLAAVLFRLFGSRSLSMSSVALCIVGVNLISHPLGWAVYAELGVHWAIVEIGVVVVEIALVRAILKTPLWLTGLVVAAANAATMAISRLW